MSTTQSNPTRDISPTVFTVLAAALLLVTLWVYLGIIKEKGYEPSPSGPVSVEKVENTKRLLGEIRE